MNGTRKPLSLAYAASLMVTGLLMTGVIAAPTASAHECYSLTPNGCGPCIDPNGDAHYVEFTGKKVMWCYTPDMDSLITPLTEALESVGGGSSNNGETSSEPEGP